ncbi:hypothetical protein VTI74DRAFT_9136 [Chaetomium olivicolor]
MPLAQSRQFEQLLFTDVPLSCNLNMICRTCLRASVGLAADTLPTQRLLLQAVQKRSLSATASARLQITRSTSLIRQLPRGSFSTTPKFFSTSSPSAEPQETSATSTTLEKPTYLSEGESKVWDVLQAEFAPTQLVVQDISGGCGSMYGIEISSEKFRGLTMLKQQRLVNAALGDLMKEWHGVQLKTRAP